jgi:hypothetical protein
LIRSEGCSNRSISGYGDNTSSVFDKDNVLMSERAKELTDRILAGGDGEAANELLEEFYEGYPVENLRVLLGSDEDAAMKVGIWIAAELGQQAATILDQLVPLLRHRLRYVRFYALPAVLAAAGENRGDVIAKGVASILDSDEGVRWMAVQFLSKASAAQLRSSVGALRGSGLEEHVEWMLSCQLDGRLGAIMESIEHENRIRRRFAVAAAVRVAGLSLQPLRHAAAASDPEVRSFSRRELARIKALDA